MEVNAYSSSSYTNNASSVGSTSDLKVQAKDESLDMKDFLNLLVAQMTNQDAMNPMDNTEFISQMAQFSSLQAMTDLSEISMQGQATSLIGKNVVVASYNNQGVLEVQEGPVQRVTIHSGETKLYVNDVEYDYSNVMEIKEAPETTEIDPVFDMLGKILEGITSMNDTLKANTAIEEAPAIEEL